MTFAYTISEQIARQWRGSPLLGQQAAKGELCSMFGRNVPAITEPRSGHRYLVDNTQSPGVGKGG